MSVPHSIAVSQIPELTPDKKVTYSAKLFNLAKPSSNVVSSTHAKTNSKYSIILEKLIKIVNIIHRRMLVGGFADQHKWLEVDISIFLTAFIFNHLHFRWQPTLQVKDIEPLIWRSFGKYDIFRSSWMGHLTFWRSAFYFLKADVGKEAEVVLHFAGYNTGHVCGQIISAHQVCNQY